MTGTARLGGLLMAAGDVDIGSWTARIDRVPMPALGWRYRRPLMLWAASAAFVVAAFLMPDRALSAGGNALQIGGDIRKLADQLQVLTREQIVPPEKAKVLEKDLERVRADAQGNDPAKTMEAMDNLAQSFRKTAAEAAESAIRQTEALSREQQLAKALETNSGESEACRRTGKGPAEDRPKARRSHAGPGQNGRANRRGEQGPQRQPFRRAEGSMPQGRTQREAARGAFQGPLGIHGSASRRRSPGWPTRGWWMPTSWSAARRPGKSCDAKEIAAALAKAKAGRHPTKPTWPHSLPGVD